MPVFLFLVGIILPVVFFSQIHKSNALDGLGLLDPHSMNSDRGKIKRNTALFHELTKINFPGYESILSETYLRLSEDSQFATPTQLLSNGERIMINIPRLQRSSASTDFFKRIQRHFLIIQKTSCNG